VANPSTALRASWSQVIVIGAGFALGAFAYPKLPGEYRVMTAFLLPTMAAVTCAIFQNILARDRDRQRDPNVARTYDAIAFWILLFVVSLHGVVLDGLVNRRTLPARLTPVLLGLALMLIGNLLPRTRPNLVFGIRPSRALNDRGVWMAVNRAAGYIAVALGTVIFLTGALLPPGTIVLQVVSIAAVVSALLLVIYWRRIRHARS
jgi:uncharacterized membrane protein